VSGPTDDRIQLYHVIDEDQCQDLYLGLDAVDELADSEGLAVIVYGTPSPLFV
jgi:hypothetical protein